MEQAKVISHKLDIAGIVVSALCAVHCFLTPILFIAAPGIAHIFEGELVHQMLFLLAVPLAVMTLVRAYRWHPSRFNLVVGLSGCALLGTGLVLHETSEVGGVVMTVVGSVALVRAHLYNILYCRDHDHFGSRP